MKVIHVFYYNEEGDEKTFYGNNLFRDKVELVVLHSHDVVFTLLEYEFLPNQNGVMAAYFDESVADCLLNTFVDTGGGQFIDCEVDEKRLIRPVFTSYNSSNESVDSFNRMAVGRFDHVRIDAAMYAMENWSVLNQLNDNEIESLVNVKLSVSYSRNKEHLHDLLHKIIVRSVLFYKNWDIEDLVKKFPNAKIV